MAQTNGLNTRGQLQPTGMQNFWMGYNVQTSPGTSGTAMTGFITVVGNTRTTGVTTYTVPAGKRLRILSWQVEITNNTSIGATTRVWCIYQMKADQTGAALTVTSPELSTTMVQMANATGSAGSFNSTITNANKIFPEGVIDLPAGSTFGIWNNATDNAIMQLMSINGYLYNA